ncbi:MAG TPA: POTRA domain-containing protein [Terriglobia bacterium]|nr:POTRA domain-containing protein [Terriglobia bacterium]
MRSRTVALLALVFTVFAGRGRAHAAAAQGAGGGWKLTAIHVSGSQRFRENGIAQAAGVATGRMTTPTALQAAAQRLAETGAFSKVSFRYGPDAGGVAVTFEVTDADQFLDCRFANFIWLPESQLLAELKRRVPLFEGQVSTAGGMANHIDRALEAILKEHGIIATVDHGFYQASMTAPVSATVFKAHGPSLPIREVVFTGTRAVDATTLADTVKQIVGQEYDQILAESTFEADTADAYHARGYLRVSFGAPQPALLAPGATSGPVRVTVSVTDGLQYNLGSIAWQGNTVFPTGELASDVSLTPGKPADAVRLEADLGDVAALYGTRGYITARAEPKPSFDDAARTVNYQIVVTEGDQYHMGQLHMLGLDADHIELLRRDCKVRLGDPFDQSYWKHFIADNASDLPTDARGRKQTLKTVVNPNAKTVDVTVMFMPAGAK